MVVEIKLPCLAVMSYGMVRKQAVCGIEDIPVCNVYHV